MAPASRVRPYKDFLTPLLHRRFARATAYLAILCYIESLVIGGIHSWFWSWFPLGRPGIRAALLFIPAFMIFILRVGQMHVGLRTSFSGWQTFKTFPKPQIIQTLGFYTLSAFIFSEIYIWSAPKDADLGRIKYIPKTERPMLNEKPIYLTSYLLILAVVQAGCHLYFDYDKINIKITKSQEGPSSAQDSHQDAHPADRLWARVVSLLLISAKRVITVSIVAPIIFSLPIGFTSYSIRSLAWGLTRSWAKIFYTLPKTSSLPSIRPFHLGVIYRTATSGFMLAMLWEVGNAAFSIYVALEPLKNERPITYESRDPNGSLLTGLRGKKIQTRAFAFWELVYISQRFEGRRKAIYEDIDRQGGSMWSQILSVSLNEVNAIERRIAEFEIPCLPKVDSSQLPTKDTGLPRLTEPLKSGINSPEDLFSSPSQKISGFETNLLTRNKTSSNTLSPRAKQLISRAEENLLSPEQKKLKESDGFVGLFRESIVGLLKFPVGKPFRQDYRRRLAAIVLGEPFGDVGIIVDAVDSLTRFAVCSLKEDKYGNVQRDVKLIIRSFTSTITRLEEFKINIGLHWTDVDGKKDSPEAELILSALKGGLNELVEAFGDYSEDLRLSQSEMRLAREAATSPSNRREMQQTGR